MLPGPTLVLKCPGCSEPFMLRTLTSGNTFGAVFYSDGKRVAPMLPASPSFHICRRCQRPFWIEDAPEEGEAEELGFSGEYARVPTAEEYRVALASGLAREREEERALRMGWWWALNDAERDLPSTGEPPERSEEWEANLGRLAGLVDPEEPETRLILGEIARERGRFDEARSHLEAAFPAELEPFAEKLRELVERGSRHVEAVFGQPPQAASGRPSPAG